mmetsp:Transcript_8396/g.24214  ORF Transcript_8396/g.24214 Transcript_8396/m.24214 type:complete len:99 (+) Transcript_8396:373-669(+)
MPVSLVVPMIASPMALILLVMAASLAFWVVTHYETATEQERQLMKGGALVIGLGIIFSGTIFLVIYGVAVGILLCIAHATFRARSIYSRVSTMRKKNM